MPGYYGIGHLSSLDNYLALVSGQAPNPQTQGDCQIFSEFLPGQTTGPDGQAVGQGCVYPASVKTVGDQLDAKGLSWKGYMQDMGADPAREPADLRAPGDRRAGQDPVGDGRRDQYATRHNPFVYFHSIIDDQARCDAHVVNLDAARGRPRLRRDDAELLVHHARPLRRRARRAVRGRRRRAA